MCVCVFVWTSLLDTHSNTQICSCSLQICYYPTTEINTHTHTHTHFVWKISASQCSVPCGDNLPSLWQPWIYAASPAAASVSVWISEGRLTLPIIPQGWVGCFHRFRAEGPGSWEEKVGLTDRWGIRVNLLLFTQYVGNMWMFPHFILHFDSCLMQRFTNSEGLIIFYTFLVFTFWNVKTWMSSDFPAGFLSARLHWSAAG